MTKALLEEIRDAVASELEGTTVTIKEMKKGNGVVKTGIEIRTEGSNIAPVIYIDEDKNANENISIILKAYKSSRINSIDVEWVRNYEQVKPRLRARLLNAKGNSFEVYRSAKSKGFSDLIIVPYIEVPEIKGSIRVKEKMLEEWGVTKKSVIDAALKNSAMEVKITDMIDTLAQMMGITREEALENFGGQPTDAPAQIVVSTDDNMYGAIGILSKLDYFKEKFGKFYVLPSSVHEVIVVPDNKAANGTVNEASLTDMVREVNRTTVDPQEVLGFKAYAFG